ncbi:MAG TPA: xanthine dehydrogenase family protein molybdopterin-binding subunit [Methylomirabilota bacterium]|nr:xanthine dehydrogenase family protein molybdopterin-binding subunit [Methylomirabilota bacterium]
MTTVTAIGRSVPRVDGGEKVTGLTRFAADLQLAGLLHARLVLSPHAHARILKIDARDALALPGVVAVLAGRDLPLAAPDPSDRNRSPLATERVRFAGHPVVAVLAESEAVAEDAAGLVRVEYEPLAAALDPLEAMKPEAPAVREPGEGEGDDEALAMHGAAAESQGPKEPRAPNVASTIAYARGDLAAGFAQAAVIVERRYRTSVVHQGYLEPQAAVASVDPLGNLTVWASTQALFYARSEVSEALGLPEHKIRLVGMPLGGAFGGKFVLLEPLAAALALAVKRPVALALTRTEDFLAANPAPGSLFDLKTGITRDGTLTALEARIVFDAGAFAGAPVGIAALLLGCYRFPAFDIKGYEVLTHKVGNGAYRAPGAVQAAFALESQIDEMARAIGMDPLELRLRHAVEEGDPLPSGRPWPRIGLRPCLERLREERDRRGWKAGASADGRRRRGVGVAVGGWLGGVEPSSAVCRLDRDGTLSVVVGTVDMSGTNTSLAQITAEAFGLPLDDVKVINADTEAAPYAGSSGGSKITYTVGAAVERAARETRSQVLAIAAKELEAAVEDLDIVGRAVRVRGVPDREITLEEIAKACMEFGARHEPVFGRGSVATTARAPAFAAHMAHVEVDTETGRTRVLGHLVVQDVGRALNPAAIEGQIQGAVAQGVGWALLERMAYDETGQLLTGTLMDYALPQPDQVPPVEAVLVEVPSEAGPFGAKGVGEPPVIAAAAAIANAVADATGARFTELPITSEAVVRALGAMG